ncbi:hypothetical protein AGMMS49992_32720 [Clostridia bacterium]|nr:hypothetical protein AGMMS49992_32720 [Clostridia bacterium]
MKTIRKALLVALSLALLVTTSHASTGFPQFVGSSGDYILLASPDERVGDWVQLASAQASANNQVLTAMVGEEVTTNISLTVKVQVDLMKMIQEAIPKFLGIEVVFSADYSKTVFKLAGTQCIAQKGDTVLFFYKPTYNEFELLARSVNKGSFSIIKTAEYGYIRYNEKGDEVENTISDSKSPPKIGDPIVFGQYPQLQKELSPKQDIDWIVLRVDEENNRLLLISKYILDYQPYDNIVVGQTNDWVNSSIKDWFETIFIPRAFSTEDQSLLMTHERYKTKAFLPSISDIRMLSSTPNNDADEKRVCLPTEYAITQPTAYGKTLPYSLTNGASEYVLVDARMDIIMSPPDLLKRVAGVDELGRIVTNDSIGMDDANYELLIRHFRVSDYYGIRPMIWLRYE